MKKLILATILSFIFTIGCNTAFAYDDRNTLTDNTTYYTVTSNSSPMISCWFRGTDNGIYYGSSSNTTNIQKTSLTSGTYTVVVSGVFSSYCDMPWADYLAWKGQGGLDAYSNVYTNVVVGTTPQPENGTVFSQLFTEDNWTFQQATPTPNRYYVGGATLGNPPTGITNVFTSNITSPNLLRIKRVSGATCTQIKASNGGAGIIISNSSGESPTVIGNGTTNGNYCDYVLTGWTTGESFASLAIVGQNPSVVLSGSNENIGNTINSYNNGEYDGGIAFQLCYNTCDENFIDYVDEPTCYDGIQNQNETGIDTGGICSDKTRVILDTPTTGSTTPTTEVNFTGQFYFNSSFWTSFGSFNGLILRLTNTETFEENEIYLEYYQEDELIDFETIFTLPTDTEWKAKVFIRMGVTTMGTGSNESIFSVVTPKGLNTNYTPEDCDITDIGCNFRNGWHWALNKLDTLVKDTTQAFYETIPDTLKNLEFFPFSLFKDIQTAMEDGVNGTSNVDTTKNTQYQVSMNVLGTQMKIFDMSNTENLMGGTATNIIKSILSMVLWLMFFSHVYYAILKEAERLSHGGTTN